MTNISQVYIQRKLEGLHKFGWAQLKKVVGEVIRNFPFFFVFAYLVVKESNKLRKCFGSNGEQWYDQT